MDFYSKKNYNVYDNINILFANFIICFMCVYIFIFILNVIYIILFYVHLIFNLILGLFHLSFCC